MFMMHFVRPANSREVGMIGVPKQLESLMNKDIMYEKVSQAVQGNSKPGPEHPVKMSLHANQKPYNSRQSENQKKEIVVFKKTR